MAQYTPGYVAQLLPDMTQAKVLRQAIVEWLQNHNDSNASSDELDAMHALYAKLSKDMHEYHQKWGS